MKKSKALSFSILLVSILGFLLWSCVSEPTTDLEKDAREYAKLKCELRMELDKMMNDTTGHYPQPMIDSIRKVRNEQIKKLRMQYKDDEELYKKFQDAVKEQYNTLYECKDMPNRPKAKKERQGKD